MRVLAGAVPVVNHAWFGTHLSTQVLAILTVRSPVLTMALDPETQSPAITQDEFQALEQKVLRAVEIVRHEREARAKAEAEVVDLRAQLDALSSASNMAQAQITTLNGEREAVRLRVEKMMQQIDELL